jgi:hypothetical protein
MPEFRDEMEIELGGDRYNLRYSFVPHEEFALEGGELIGPDEDEELSTEELWDLCDRHFHTLEHEAFIRHCCS